VKVSIWHRRSLFELAAEQSATTAEITRDEAARAAEHLFRGYRPGDRITRICDYDVPAELGFTGPEAIAAQAFRMFNDMPEGDWEQAQTDRYYAQRHRSLSVGDIVVVGEVALSCEPQGWDQVAIDPRDEV
jgi:hypothetical protein